MTVATNGLPAVYEFGDFRLDAGKRLLWRAGAPIPLRPRVFETLLFLVEHHDTVLDKERLMEAVWPDSIVEENNLTQHISILRRVFGETPGAHHYIVTVPGRGYRFVADVKMRNGNGAVVAGIGYPGPGNAENGEAKPGSAIPATTIPATTAIPTRWFRRVTVVAGAILLLAGFALFWWRSSPQKATTATSTSAPFLPEKSIAVLPFANLSDDKENAFFTEGVQDDILTALAKFSDLKVISRTSVANYVAGPNRKLREIGEELGVANVLEGSVRRAGGKVRVTAQLIDTRTNTHLWAETYDRELSDVFAIQSDIAQQIADALEAKLAPEEKARLDARPTANPEAYVLYLTALGTEDFAEAEKLYLQAVALDPGFALAYAQASLVNSRIGGDFPERRARARAQAEEALRLAPGLSEAHMALGLCLNWADKKYDAALREFEIAEKTSPNNAEIQSFIAGIYRRQGRWRESIARFERAFSLDPRNRNIAFLAANNYLRVRDWRAAEAGFHRALAIKPDSVLPKIGLAYLEVFRNGNAAAGRKILEAIPANPESQDLITASKWDLAMLERDYPAAEKILADGPNFSELGDSTKAYYQGRVARARGDLDSAQHYFAAAESDFEKRVTDDPNSAERHDVLALLYAYMQRKEDAIREARRAVELEPESQNAFHGTAHTATLALVYTLTGEPDQALPLIERLLTTPGPIECSDFPYNITLADLRLRWEWDSLRSNPRFQKILAGAEPETVLINR